MENKTPIEKARDIIRKNPSLITPLDQDVTTDQKSKVFLRRFLKKMHREILTDKQLQLLPLIKRFNKSFGLVGGTAFALHLGH
ncbi:MAG: hypothetical protein WC988_04195, partial [Patescibacteria group bacterium]